MRKEFSTQPRSVPHVQTRYRRIATPLPHPDSLATLETLRRYEPQSMRGQPPVVWDRAEDVCVFDKFGNQWLDWTSGVLVANCGHGAPEIRQAIAEQAASGLLHNYVFPSAQRAELVRALAESRRRAGQSLPANHWVRSSRMRHQTRARVWFEKGRSKQDHYYRSRTRLPRAHARCSTGRRYPGPKSWIVNEDPAICQVPFPDGYWTEDTRFDVFRRVLEQKGVTVRTSPPSFSKHTRVGPDFAPTPYIHKLAEWCTANGALLIFDEVQAGFGRTGKFWAFEHYGVVPDVICCGKGISSSLPLSAVIGRSEIMDQFPPGSMTSTHTGNPVCCAAALASLCRILSKDLTGNAARVGATLEQGLIQIQQQHPAIIGRASCRGLVGGLQIVRPGTKEPDHATAHAIIENCFYKGLLLFAPVGAWDKP
jgi:4-aminobutyrate aminotransferase-like enzyme